MAHPLANDPSVPAILRAAFARVTHQIVRTYADGSEWSWNLNSVQTPNRFNIIAAERRHIGKVRDGMTLVAVEIRAVA